MFHIANTTLRWCDFVLLNLFQITVKLDWLKRMVPSVSLLVSSICHTYSIYVLCIFGFADDVLSIGQVFGLQAYWSAINCFFPLLCNVLLILQMFLVIIFMFVLFLLSSLLFSGLALMKPCWFGEKLWLNKNLTSYHCCLLRCGPCQISHDYSLSSFKLHDWDTVTVVWDTANFLRPYYV